VPAWIASSVATAIAVAVPDVPSTEEAAHRHSRRYHPADDRAGARLIAQLLLCPAETADAVPLVPSTEEGGTAIRRSSPSRSLRR
jgi:hypothetical protein